MSSFSSNSSFEEKIEAVYEKLKKDREEEDQRIEASGRLDYYRPRNISEATIKHNRLVLIKRHVAVKLLLHKKDDEIHRHKQNEPTPMTDAHKNKLTTLQSEQMALLVELAAIIKLSLEDSAKVAYRRRMPLKTSSNCGWKIY
ncbi:uncharacterized protein LOC122856250 [Aphidius gifuensis]|uniref:uncharacterized protein LOC122856250 n=1 Tax=Aphidius gifuensis TaxID=684658 RepID=UPI001CDB9434|nr:uncharacterized protein LOC122856250 [Aphidius gifuensis]